MNEQELKLQAYFDGELPPAEAREVVNLLARDSDATALIHTLKVTRRVLSGFEAGTKLPESREFYWSKIRREIERTEVMRPEPAKNGLFYLLRRALVPAAGVAMLVIAAMFVTRGGSGATEFETASADPKAFTYRDYSAGTTLVWLSYPAEREPGDDSWMSVLD
jgi:anti-sigma factor RsiW